MREPCKNGRTDRDAIWAEDQGTAIIWGVHWRNSWRRGTVVERRSLTGELSLSCARPAADG